MIVKSLREKVLSFLHIFYTFLDMVVLDRCRWGQYSCRWGQYSCRWGHDSCPWGKDSFR